MYIGDKIKKTFNPLFSSNNVVNHTNEKQIKNVALVEPVDIQEIYDELDSLIGLDNIKDLIKEIKAFVHIDQKRKETNLATEPLVFHMIFSGNPGTGKTTVARILGKLFKSLQILESGHVVEVERADLVGEFVGQTAHKVKAKIQEAMGGILFIDEAYSLARGGEKDFGKEAIDTLVKSMEDYKNEFILILAGYRKEMNFFLMSNPGLRSRFPIKLAFNDYSIDELLKIAEKIAEERQYKITLDGKRVLYNILVHNKLNNESEKHGNAREIRNIMESTIRRQALRLSKKINITREDLIYLKGEDFKYYKEK